METKMMKKIKLIRVFGEMIQSTSSTRQGFYILFILLILFVGATWLKWFDIFGAFIIICLAGIILKLTDIEEAIKER